VGEVSSLYRNNGYLYSQVQPYLTRREPEEEGGDPIVDVGWNITEGQPAYVRRVDVVGNDFTHERVIREQIFILPGDIYNEGLLIQSWQGVQSLGFFETPMEPPSINPDPQTGEVDIVFQVRERQTGSVNFGTALGGGVGLSGFIGYEQPNLFGQAKSGSLRWDFGRYTNNFVLSYADPSLRQSRISGSVSLFNSRDRFFRFNTGQRRRVGATVRFGFPIPSAPRTRFFAGYSIARTDYELREGETDSSIFGLPPGLLSAINLGLTRATLNHPIFPTSGSRQSVNLDFNGGFLGGDGDFSKLSVEATWYVPAGQIGGSGPGAGGVRMTLGLSARGGTIFGDASDFPFEQFWLGGVQFGEKLRGYDETTITPLGYFPRGSNLISDANRLGPTFFALYGEYALRFGDTLSLSLFYDAGNVWGDASAVDPTRLYRGAGIGAQIVTPFGPMGIDYAYGFDKIVPGWQLHFRFGPGM
jgi:outer membrane protein insertion porin family